MSDLSERRLAARPATILLLLEAATSLAVGMLAIRVLPNFIPVLAVGVSQGLLVVILLVTRAQISSWAPAYVGFSAVATAVVTRTAFPVFLSADAVQSLFLLLVYGDAVLLGTILALDHRARRIPLYTLPVAVTAFLIARIPEAPWALAVAAVTIQALTIVLTILISRLHREHERGKRQLGEIERLASRLAIVSAQLMERRRREDLAMMTAGIAHEVSNPVNYMQGNVRFLRTRVAAIVARLRDRSADHETEWNDEAEAEVDELLESFDSGTRTIQHVVQRLRDTFRPGAGDPEPVKVGALVRSCAASLGYRRGGPFTLVIEVPSALTVTADPADLYTIFVNIIKNAHEATGGDGTLTVTAEVIGEMLTMTFQDDGPGIASGELDRVFDPFYSTKAGSDGLGIGLALCKSIVEQNGGEISMESKPGRFTRVCVTLPASGPAAVTPSRTE